MPLSSFTAFFVGLEGIYILVLYPGLSILTGVRNMFQNFPLSLAGTTVVTIGDPSREIPAHSAGQSFIDGDEFSHESQSDSAESHAMARAQVCSSMCVLKRRQAPPCLLFRGVRESCFAVDGPEWGVGKAPAVSLQGTGVGKGRGDGCDN
jgi:hypothetical protein